MRGSVTGEPASEGSEAVGGELTLPAARAVTTDPSGSPATGLAAGHEVLGHARHEQVDLPLPAAAVAAGPLVGLDPIDEGWASSSSTATREVSGASTRERRRGRWREPATSGSVAPRGADELVGERVVGARVAVRVEHGPRIAQRRMVARALPAAIGLG